MIKKVYLAATLALLFSKSAFANNQDSVFKKKTLRKTDIEILYSHYLQDGNNSAVTGGKGTEKLSVSAPSVNLSTSGKNLSWKLKAGTDIITSASTDNIDFVQSSASRRDARTYANLSALMPVSKQINLELGSGFSVESDYLSRSLMAAINGQSKNKMRQWLLESKCYFDDLRWGRLNPNYKRPVRLVYPVELRNQDWFTNYKRQSFNVKFGLSQVVNKRNVIGIYPTLTLQNGLLSTPFHRVVFNNSETRVENLPDQRIKLAISSKWNTFIGGRLVLKNTIESYWDNFGVNALGIESELAIKLKNGQTISPFARLYKQSASKYFAPYAVHHPDEAFYCSDYDFSRFYSVKMGVEFKIKRLYQIRKHLDFQGAAFRYAFYYRSNHLYAHTLSLSLNLQQIHK